MSQIGIRRYDVNNLLMAGIVIFFAFFIAGRGITEKGMRQLNEEEKVRLLDSLSGYRIFLILPPLLIFLLYFVLIRIYRADSAILMPVFFCILFAYVIVENLLVYRKLKENGIPAGYLKSYLISKVFTFVGFIALLGFYFLSIMYRPL